MIENVSTQLTVFHCFAHCLLPGRAFTSLYVLLFLEKEAEIGGRVFRHYISHKITFGAPSSGRVLCSACGAFINSLHVRSHCGVMDIWLA